MTAKNLSPFENLEARVAAARMALTMLRLRKEQLSYSVLSAGGIIELKYGFNDEHSANVLARARRDIIERAQRDADAEVAKLAASTKATLASVRSDLLRLCIAAAHDLSVMEASL